MMGRLDVILTETNVRDLIPSCDVLAGNHGSCIHHLGPDICFDEYN